MTTDTATRTDTFYAGTLLNYLNVRSENAAARAWDSIIRGVIYTGKRTTARAWMEAHTAHDIRTLQATVRHDGNDVRNVWTPGPRRITATRAGSVALDGSTRDYAGLRVVAASTDTLVCVTAWGDDMQVCVYTTREN